MMARYFLNVRDGSVVTRDPTPYGFVNDQAARDAALQTIRELLAAHPDDHAFDSKQIEIADDAGNNIAFVTMRDVMDEPIH